MRSSVWPALAAFVVLTACGEQETSKAGGSGGSAGQASAGRDASAGRSGGAGTGNASGSGGNLGNEGGQSGDAGSSEANAGQGAVAGSSNASCTPPKTVPVGGSACPAACEGKNLVYEDCNGDGLVQALCGTDWFLLQSPCGDHRCQAGGNCGAGSVCMELVGGAQLMECRPHACGTGPITCDCLKAACPGSCTQTGPIDFSCNTCPSGNCP